MPRVGSSKMKMSASLSTHLPMTTFCWLPPESCMVTSLTDGVLIRSFRTISRLSRSISFLLSIGPNWNLRMLARIRLVLTDWLSTSPWPFRSSVRNAMPCRMAAPGFLMATFFPLM